MKSKVVTLSAVSAALTALSLIVGAYFEFADLFMLIIASSLTLLPLYYNSYKGSILASIVGGIIAFICSGFNIMSLVFPAYFAFFAFFPIVKIRAAEKQFNKTLMFILGLIWFVAVSYGMYFYYTLIMNGVFDGLPEFIHEYILGFVGILSIIFYMVYNRFVLVVKYTIDRYLVRIIK